MDDAFNVVIVALVVSSSSSLVLSTDDATGQLVVEVDADAVFSCVSKILRSIVLLIAELCNLFRYGG